MSIIVPTFNRRERLERFLRSLDTLTENEPEFEVVVVVDGSNDGTVEMLEAFQPRYRLRSDVQPNRGPAAARNRAIALARGEILLFLDDDVVPVPGLIGRHLAAHRGDPAAVVIGPMLSPRNAAMAPWLRWEAAMLEKQYAAMRSGWYAPTPRQFYTANASVRRDDVLEAGGFDERFRRTEDVELACRLADRGLRFYFLPDAAVFHEPDRTLAAWRHMAYEYGRHDVLLSSECGRAYALRAAFREFSGRHRLTRALLRFCVGHAQRFRLCIEGLSWLLRSVSLAAPDRLRFALCSAAFNVEYWQGIADATCAGPRVWEYGQRLMAMPPAAVPAFVAEAQAIPSDARAPSEPGVPAQPLG